VHINERRESTKELSQIDDDYCPRVHPPAREAKKISETPHSAGMPVASVGKEEPVLRSYTVDLGERRDLPETTYSFA
jgi:hypothetical protein